MMDIIQQIKRAVAARDLLVVVGPGVYKCAASEPAEAGDQNGAWNNPWPLELMNLLTPQNLQLIKAVAKLNCPIVTTSYDLLLEQVLRREPVIWKTYHDRSSLNRSILHIYGHCQDPESLIFDQQKHEELSANESVCAQLQTLVENKTLLLIGCENEKDDPNVSYLLRWISHLPTVHPTTIIKLIRSDHPCSLLQNIHEIPYGRTFDDLLSFVVHLRSFSNLLHANNGLDDRKVVALKKYLHYLIDEYGYVSIFGHSSNEITLPLERVYVELRFDPTHPSIRAMRSVDINEEFKRRVLAPHFFTDNERRKLTEALIGRHAFNPQTIYRDLMIDQWLNALLSNRTIFSEDEATTIQEKASVLKQSILEKNNLNEARQYQIRQAYFEMKHSLILGHPGSGKTTVSKWIVTNMAKQCLGQPNLLFDGDCSAREKIPILIPIWKYVDQNKIYKRSLLQFIHEHVTLDSTLFTDGERMSLSSVIMEALLRGNLLIILEGLDEVPDNVDRTDLLKEINALLERGIDYDVRSGQLIHSPSEHKEVNNTRDPTHGNRLFITSRIEGNFFEEINFYIPRLTIQDMSNEALRLFCRSYTQSNDDQLYNEIAQNKEIFQLAINPQLASVIASVYNQQAGKLPEKRIDLYERAIEKMVDRLVTSSMNEQLRLTPTLLWSILQSIAAYLHSKVEGLSENSLRELIRKTLIDHEEYTSTCIDKLVEIFKYKVGLLNEFGYNSFRFIHRTFQEYLAAKSLIYSNGEQRSLDAIYESIVEKIAIPNWRVPLSMTFGMLTACAAHNDRILNRLTSSNNLLVPFVLIDSLPDMHFSNTDAEAHLIRQLADMLLKDYKNRSGFARLVEHQKLIHSYFLKLKQKSSTILAAWFMKTLHDQGNIAPCANIIHELKWFHHKFYRFFLKHLHHDSHVWNWPVDFLLRSYSTTASEPIVLHKLHLKRILIQRPDLVERIRENEDWLTLIAALYGGFANYRTQDSIAEYLQMTQFLQLSDNERAPFLFYYQSIWGKDDPAYRMAVYLDTFKAKDNWNKVPLFDPHEIYKESFLTPKILELLQVKRAPTDVIPYLRRQISSSTLDCRFQAEAGLALLVLGDIDVFTNDNVRNRLEQLIDVLRDPIARCSSLLGPYLLTVAQHMKNNPSDFDFTTGDYCRIYLDCLAESGGLPVDTILLAQMMESIEDKTELFAEYFASSLTAATESDFEYEAAMFMEKSVKLMKGDLIMKTFLKMSNAVQTGRPVRAYLWPMDQFVFQTFSDDDIPIAFFNCLENMHPNLTLIIATLCDVFIEEGYFTRNADLIIPVILLLWGITSSKLDRSAIYEKLLPELATTTTHIRPLISERIYSMTSPYYKSRALYQLAQFDDQRSLQLLQEAFQTAQDIPDACQRFQVLEKIYSVAHYKECHAQTFIEQVVHELKRARNDIDYPHDQVIATVRLSFYESSEGRKARLTDALQILATVEENREKVQLMIKLKSVVSIDGDLSAKLEKITDDLKKKTNYYLVKGYHGKILAAGKAVTVPLVDGSKSKNLEMLFRLMTRLNDVKLMNGKGDRIHQLWANVSDRSSLDELMSVALHDEVILTPSIAMIIDQFVQRGEESAVALLYPYIIKPSNEALPIVHRWFSQYPNSQVRKLAALLLAEAKYLFEGAMETLIEMLDDNCDQIRYRTQRLFQHPERDPNAPSKRISILGEKVLLKIVHSLSAKDHLIRREVYLRTLFLDLDWDDPQVYENLRRHAHQMLATSPITDSNVWYFNRMMFLSPQVWHLLMRTLKSPVSPFYVEELLHSTMQFIENGQINRDQWMDFAGILATTDTSQFRVKLFYTRLTDEVSNLMINEIFAAGSLNEDNYFENLESKLMREVSIDVKECCRMTYQQIKHICRCTFRVSTRDLNGLIRDALNNLPITASLLENLLRWVMRKMNDFQKANDSWYSLVMHVFILSLVAACVQKEDYLYRKVTNSYNFNKKLLIELLSKVIHHHMIFAVRGAAFILLAALDLPAHDVIIKALDALFDENIVKAYTSIGIPLIHLPANAFIDDLLKSLNDQSAIKVYELLKIITQFALDEKIDANCKSRIVNYIGEHIGQIESKKLVNYYYTDIKISFTTTLEKELYQTWLKIQGLAGKTDFAGAT